MRHASVADSSGSSPEVRIAAAMVGAGAVLGVLLLVAAGMLFTVDPGFLFVVLPFVIGAALIAGFQLLTVSVTLSRRLLKHRPGARLQTAVVGGSVLLAGVAGATMDPRMGLPVACYGAVLLWLMTTSAAARDLGPWIVVRAPRQRPQRQPWFMPAAKPSSPAATDQPSPYLLGTDLPPNAWQRPQRTWIELWQEGLSRGIPILDLIALCIAMVAFFVGQVLLFVGLAGHNALLPLAIVLVGAAIAVCAFLERRLKARLGYA